MPGEVTSQYMDFWKRVDFVTGHNNEFAFEQCGLGCPGHIQTEMQGST